MTSLPHDSTERCQECGHTFGVHVRGRECGVWECPCLAFVASRAQEAPRAETHYHEFDIALPSVDGWEYMGCECGASECTGRGPRSRRRAATPAGDPETPPAPMPVWLIERGQAEGQSPPMWWRSSGSSDSSYEWTETASAATPFATQTGARRMLDALSGIAGVHSPFGRVTEHVFLAPLDSGPRAPTCPTCRKPLEEIRYPSDSFLNRDQWESQVAGEWWCSTCPSNGRGKSGAYYWQHELPATATPAGPASEPTRAWQADYLAIERMVRSLGESNTLNALLSMREDRDTLTATLATQAHSLAVTEQLCAAIEARMNVVEADCEKRLAEAAAGYLKQESSLAVLRSAATAWKESRDVLDAVAGNVGEVYDRAYVAERDAADAFRAVLTETPPT